MSDKNTCGDAYLCAECSLSHSSKIKECKLEQERVFRLKNGNVYPKEMVHIDTGALVLFNSEGCGIVIDPGSGSYRVNEHLNNADMDDWITV